MIFYLLETYLNIDFQPEKKKKCEKERILCLLLHSCHSLCRLSRPLSTWWQESQYGQVKEKDSIPFSESLG